MKITPLFIFSGFFLGSWAVSAAETATADRSAPGGTPAGMTIYKDPVTGEFKAPPPDASPAPGTPTSSSQPAEQPPAGDLQTTTPSQPTVNGVPQIQTSPRSGTMVDLRGRVRAFMTATKGADGKISVECNIDHDHSVHETGKQ